MSVNGVPTGMVSTIMQKAVNIIRKALQSETHGFFVVAAATVNPGLRVHLFASPAPSITGTITWVSVLPEHLNFLFYLSYGYLLSQWSIVLYLEDIDNYKTIPFHLEARQI